MPAADQCHDCRWWHATEYASANRGAGEPNEPGLWGACGLIGDLEDRQPDPVPQSERAFTRDASDYKSWLMTRSDFGCIEWEAPDAP